MDVIIGIKQADGKIRYIQTQSPTEFNKIVPTLRNFYKTKEDANALINLGNLVFLGLNPYTKSKGDNDLINCEAKIRDNKLSENKHSYCFSSNEDEFARLLRKQDSCCKGMIFLFDESNWYILVADRKTELSQATPKCLERQNVLEGLEIRLFNPENSYNKFSKAEDFHSWEEIKETALRTNQTYYIYQKGRLLTIINKYPVENRTEAVLEVTN